MDLLSWAQYLYTRSSSVYLILLKIMISQFKCQGWVSRCPSTVHENMPVCSVLPGTSKAWFQFSSLSMMLNVFHAAAMCTLSNGTKVPGGTSFRDGLCTSCHCRSDSGIIHCILDNCPIYPDTFQCPAGQEVRTAPGKCCPECLGEWTK